MMSVSVIGQNGAAHDAMYDVGVTDQIVVTPGESIAANEGYLRGQFCTRLMGAAPSPTLRQTPHHPLDVSVARAAVA